MRGYGYQREYTIGNIYGVKADVSNPRTVRIGRVGAGSASQGRHLPALMRLMAAGAPIQVLSIADPIEDWGKKVASLYVLRSYADPEGMLGGEHVDGVLFCT